MKHKYRTTKEMIAEAETLEEKRLVIEHKSGFSVRKSGKTFQVWAFMGPLRQGIETEEQAYDTALEFLSQLIDSKEEANQ